jgi:hypothetical protein
MKTCQNCKHSSSNRITETKINRRIGNYIEEPNLEKSAIIPVLAIVLECDDAIWEKLAEIYPWPWVFFESFLDRPGSTTNSNKFITMKASVLLCARERERERENQSQGKRGSGPSGTEVVSWESGKITAMASVSASTVKFKKSRPQKEAG